MYLDAINIIFIKPCTTGGGRVKFRSKMSHSIDELLPYLNAEIKTALYIPSAKTFTYKIENHIITINSDELTCTQLTNEAECYEMADQLKDVINGIASRKDSITPYFETRERPNAVQLYKLLPQKRGCKDCGQPSCMAFSSKLILGNVHLNDCPHIKAKEFAPNYLSLESHLQLLGYETE